jgi:hypothetical protein
MPRTFCAPQRTSAYVSTRQHTSAYGRIRQHTSAYELVHAHPSRRAPVALGLLGECGRCVCFVRELGCDGLRSMRAKYAEVV